MEQRATGRLGCRLIPLLVLLLGFGRAFAQAPGTSPQGQHSPIGPGAPVPAAPAASAKAPKDDALSEALLFRIRSAFSLSPVMIASLQAKGSDPGASPVAGAAPAAAPGAAKGEAAAQEKGVLISWSASLVREVPFSVPLDIRLVGKNVLALVQLTPIETGADEINLLVQGQVWVQKPDGTLSFNTSFQSLNIALGSRLYFYPLGVDARNGAPIAVEIKVDRSPAK